MAEGAPIGPARLAEVDQILALWREAEAEGRMAGTVIGLGWLTG